MEGSSLMKNRLFAVMIVAAFVGGVFTIGDISLVQDARASDAICDLGLENPEDPADGSCSSDGTYTPPTDDDILCGIQNSHRPEDGECDDDGHYTPPGGGGDTEGLWNLTQGALIAGYDNIALLVNTADSVTQNGDVYRLTMERTALDRDDDGHPDAYKLNYNNNNCKLAHSGKPCPSGQPYNQIRQNKDIYIQSDFVYGPLEDGIGMVIEPSTGNALFGEAEFDDENDSLIVRIKENSPDDEFARITFNPLDPQERLILQVFSKEHQRFESPGFWSAPFLFDYVKILPTGDIDDDRYTDEQELQTQSHPVNGRSTFKNVDGDLCPETSDKNDHDPSVCLPYPWFPHVSIADSDPTDALGLRLWEQTTITVGASVNPIWPDNDLTPPKIAEWSVYMFGGSYGVTNHDPNYTVGAEDFGELKRLFPSCDMMPATAAETAKPAEAIDGEDYDGDPRDHTACPLIRDPVYIDDEDSDDILWTEICSGTTDLLVPETCEFDTTQFVDGEEIHLWAFVCMEDEDCSVAPGTVPKEKDITDHVGVSPHFSVSNKPFLQLHDLPVDVDGITEKPGKLAGDVLFSLDAFHKVGHAMETIEITHIPFQHNDDGDPVVGGFGSRWTWNVSGMSEGESRPVEGLRVLPGLDRGPFPNETHPEILADATITLADADNHTYEILMDSGEWYQDAATIGGSFIATAQAEVGPRNIIENWPSKGEIKYFNNQAPDLYGFSVEGLSKDVENENATLKFRTHYKDIDHNSGTPSITVTVHEVGTGDLVGSTSDCVKFDHRTVKVGLPNNLNQPRPNYDADYDCAWETDLSGIFTWNVTAVDPDGGDNTTVEESTVELIIDNAAALLEEGATEVSNANMTGKDTRHPVEFRVRYVDDDDAPAFVKADVYELDATDTPQFVETLTMERCVVATTKPLEDNDQAANRGDFCADKRYDQGDYRVRYRAESLRGDTAVFPQNNSLLPFEVASKLAVICPACGSDEEHIDTLREAINNAIEEFNEVSESSAPGIPQAYRAVALTCEVRVCYGDTDTDGDNWPDADELANDPPTDPNNHWEHPGDTDADLIPNLLEDRNVVSDLFYITAEGKLQLKERPTLQIYESTVPGQRSDPLFELVLNEEGHAYTLTMDGGKHSNALNRKFSGLHIAEYELTPSGFSLYAHDTLNHEVRITLDITALTQPDGRFLSIKADATDDQYLHLEAAGNPVNVYWSNKNVNNDVEEDDLNEILGDGTPRSGLRFDQYGRLEFYVDTDGDGEADESVSLADVDPNDPDGLLPEDGGS